MPLFRNLREFRGSFYIIGWFNFNTWKPERDVCLFYFFWFLSNVKYPIFDEDLFVINFCLKNIVDTKKVTFDENEQQM